MLITIGRICALDMDAVASFLELGEAHPQNGFPLLVHSQPPVAVFIIMKTSQVVSE